MYIPKKNLYIVRMKAFLKYEKIWEELNKILFFCLENKLYCFSVKESQCQPLELVVLL